MPILNQAGVPQVSPANTRVGLTTTMLGSPSGQSVPYAPTGTRTYLRIVPLDSVQGAALLLAMQGARCIKAAMADDEPVGSEVAKLVELEKRFYRVDLVSEMSIAPAGPGLRASVAAIRALRPGCLLLAGVGSRRR